MARGQFARLFLAVCLLMYTSAAIIPKGFILDVNVNCGKTSSDTPSIKVTSDMHLDVRAYCANGVIPVTTKDYANYLINGTYAAGKPAKGVCQFSNRAKSTIYTVDVAVAFGLVGKTIQAKPHHYTLTCTFDANGKEITSPIKVTRGYVAPEELRVDAGSKTSSVITLDVFNVRDQAVSKSLIRGVKVYLSAKTDGSNKEKGLRPTACDAINPATKVRVPVLRAGCGTGLILPKASGFTSKGNSVRSPYFETVQIERDAKIQFECVFTLCTKACDGNSCSVNKVKRSAEEQFETSAVVRSSPHDIEEGSLE